MKNLLLIFTLLFSTVFFSSPSYAKWTMMGENTGITFYVDFERVRKVDGFVYYWTLINYLKPTKQGHLSDKTYHQGDCKLFRYKILSGSFHKEPMGSGTGNTPPIPEKHKDWKYPSPGSMIESVLKSVCSR
jgi:hypothetical protein